tara:strand:+ start:3676 stop:3957 length:282 start_codon:yes stop_codon:yes gene_type:complete
MARFYNINGTKVQFTAEEEAARNAQEQAWADGANDRAAVSVREERDALLAACDWKACSDVTMSDAWRDYRQALRDVSTQASFPSSITWPTEPK